MSQDNNKFFLIEAPAEKKIIDTLYSKGLINHQAYDLAQALLYPPRRWGYWTANVLSIVGGALLIIGTILFLSAYWHKMTIFHKFSIIEIALLCSVIGAWAYSRNEHITKFFLITASLLVGVFLTVFSLSYQTDHLHYTLFMLWTLLITPWVVIGRSTLLWILWITLLNATVIVYWHQALQGNVRLDDLIFALLLTLNTLILLKIEFISHKALPWFNAKLLKIILVIYLLLIASIPVNNLILLITGHHSFFAIFNIAMLLGGAMGIALHYGLFWFYIYKAPDIGILALTAISASLLLCDLFYNILKIIGLEEVTLYFSMSILTLGTFMAAVLVLRKIKS